MRLCTPVANSEPIFRTRVRSNTVTCTLSKSLPDRAKLHRGNPRTSDMNVDFLFPLSVSECQIISLCKILGLSKQRKWCTQFLCNPAIVHKNCSIYACNISMHIYCTRIALGKISPPKCGMNLPINRWRYPTEHYCAGGGREAQMQYYAAGYLFDAITSR